MIVPPRLPPEIKTIRPLVIAQAKRADGSTWTDAFRTLDEGRQALLDRAWISADFFLWEPIYVAPKQVFLTHAQEALVWGKRA